MNLQSSGPVGVVPPPRDDAVTGEGTRPTDNTSAEATGLPGIRRWRTVYWIVFGVFVLWVGLLTWLTRSYS
jgi:hypothetical protein